MSDNELNEVKKAKRPYVAPESMRKYSMTKKELKALRSEHQERIERLKGEMDTEDSFHAANAIRYHLIGESELQIRLIDALL